MAASPGNFLKPLSNPYRMAPASYPPSTGPFLQPPHANHNRGTYIVALLNNNGGGGREGAVSNQNQLHMQPVVSTHEIARSFPSGSGPIRVPRCKLPKGRRLSGEHAVYDVDVRLHGEIQPQLEVTPITKYASDPQLVLGRQIAVNKVYICYGLKGGNIRVLHINTALRSFFRGHSQRVTDMAFFAEDVHLLASVSLDGKVFVWNISEGSEGEDQSQITGKIVLALQILGEEDTKHRRVCWHCHKQEILVVSIGKHVLRIDTTKVGRGEVSSAEAPLLCPLDNLIDGVQIVGKHDGEVTALSMCQWLATRLVSSSVDGTIKIWQDRKGQPPAVLIPHDGNPVYSATFVTSPERPDHVILITGGPLNREIKIWVSTGDEGWLIPADAESWRCTQTLDLKSSSEPRAEEAFFNQVIALSEVGLLLLGNAKRNALYAVHLAYGSCPVDTRMDYLSEFTVTMPILSFIGTNDPPEDTVVNVFCVHTLAIQQYTLDLFLCLPPPIENVSMEKSDSSVSREANLIGGASEPFGLKQTELPSVDSVPKPSIPVNRSERATTLSCSVGPASAETTSPAIVPSNGEPKTYVLPSETSDAGSAYSVERQIDAVGERNFDVSSIVDSSSKKEKNVMPDDPVSGIRSPPDFFEHFTHLVTPSDLLMGFSSTEASITTENKRDRNAIFQNVNNVARGKEKNVMPYDPVSGIRSPPDFFKHATHLVTPSEILMGVSSTEASITTENKRDRNAIFQNVNNVARGIELEVKEVGEARSTLNGDIIYHEETENHTSESREKIFCTQASNLSIEMIRDRHPITEETFLPEDSMDCGQFLQAGVGSGLHSRGVSAKLPKSVSSSVLPQPAATNSKGKKQKVKSIQGPGLSSYVANMADTYNGQSRSSSAMTDSLPRILALEEKINQIMISQKEMQRQLSNDGALWARFQEEIVKNEKALHDHAHQIVNATTNFMSKELNAMFEKTVKKEFATIGPVLARAVTPVIEKTVTSSITESFQRGIVDNTVNKLDKSVNSKLETTIASQILAQFQTSGRQALQEALRSSLESSVIPSFERSCKIMFEQVDSAFRKRIAEHTSAAQQRFDSGHSQLAHTLKETISSASSDAHALSRELAESQKNLSALTAAESNSGGSNPLVTQLSNGPLGSLLVKVEAPMDPTTELMTLISEQKYEESFTSALQRSDASIVSWLCSQVDLSGLMAMNPLPLSQGVLLSLLQQLACDISEDTSRKLAWMKDVVKAIDPPDEMIARY